MKNSIKRAQVSAFRLARHHLDDKSHADITTVSRDICGVQAQVMSAAHMAMWARMRNLTKTEIETALYKSRTLVKTNCMRATLHILEATDYPNYIAALKKSRVRQMFGHMARYGVTEAEGIEAKEAALKLLACGPMTRRSVTQRVLAETKLSKKARYWFKRSWWGVVHQGIVEGSICYGTQTGGEVTLVRVDQWLAKQKIVSEEGALKFLLGRFFSAYGPATLHDFCKWAGMAVPEGKAAGELLKEELVEVNVDGNSALILRDDLAQLRNSSFQGATLRLLPNFDPYMLAHVEKDHLVDPRNYKRVYRNQGWISPVILLNGRVIGLWSIQRGAKKPTLEIEPFENISRKIRTSIEEEAASLGRFHETSWEIKFHR
jgi:Winged helix DNA-binding domain